MSDFDNDSDLPDEGGELLKLILFCLLCVAVGSGLTFAGLALRGESGLPAKEAKAIRPQPKYKPGDWVQSKLGGKCGIVHDVDNDDWKPQADYDVRFPDGKYRQGYWTDYLFEGELDWCSSPTSGTSRITVSPLESAATSSELRAVK